MQSSNEFVVATQMTYTKEYIVISLLQVNELGLQFVVEKWKFRAPYSVGLLLSLALMSNVKAGVITDVTACANFIESFSKLSHRDRVGYTRILCAERVLGNSQFVVHCCARDYAVEDDGFNLRKRAFLIGNAPMSSLEGNFNVVQGICPIGELVRGACYVTYE